MEENSQFVLQHVCGFLLLDLPAQSLLLHPGFFFFCHVFMDLDEITDLCAPLPQLCPLGTRISQFNLVHSFPLMMDEDSLWLPHTNSTFPSVVRWNSASKKTHLQALTTRKGCRLSSGQLDMHFQGIQTSHKICKCTQILQTLQRVLLLSSMFLLSRRKASSGLQPRKMRVSYTKAPTSPCQKWSVLLLSTGLGKNKTKQNTKQKTPNQ